MEDKDNDNQQKDEFSHSSHETQEVIVPQQMLNNSSSIDKNYIPKNEDIEFISNKIDAKIDGLGGKIDGLGVKIENLITILCQLHGKEVEVDNDGRITIKQDSISNFSNNSSLSQNLNQEILSKDLKTDSSKINNKK